MLHSLRTVAALMLIAGICMGVFASTLMANKRPQVEPTLDSKIEERVKEYREFFNLDVGRTDMVRRELQRHRRELRDLLLELRERHQEEFSTLVQKTESRISKIVNDER